MNAALPLCMAQALAPFAPPQSIVHRIVAADRDYNELKNSGELERRRFEQAMRSQHQQQDAIVGSSRVDLQACKLEYSIVSPK